MTSWATGVGHIIIFIGRDNMIWRLIFPCVLSDWLKLFGVLFAIFGRDGSIFIFDWTKIIFVGTLVFFHWVKIFLSGHSSRRQPSRRA